MKLKKWLKIEMLKFQPGGDEENGNSGDQSGNNSGEGK
jgi:hypothetical protein